MIQIKIDKKMAAEIAYSFFADIHTYVDQHRDEFEKFLIEEAQKEKQESEGKSKC